MGVIDGELLKLALRPHVPLIRFKYGVNANKIIESAPKPATLLFGAPSKKIWYSDRPRRPAWSQSEIESVNVQYTYIL